MYEHKEEDGSILMTGEKLKFYYDEHRIFSEVYGMRIVGSAIKIMFKKLKRHYKLHQSLYFGARKNGHFRGGYIVVPSSTCVGLLCHEVAHAIDAKKRSSKHDRRLMRILTRVVNYCKTKNYWKEEIDKRTTVKVKPVPSKEEVQDSRITKRKADLARYEKKLAYYTKLYSNKIKKTRRSILMLEKYKGGTHE